MLDPLQQLTGTFEATFEQLYYLSCLLEDQEDIASFSWWPLEEEATFGLVAHEKDHRPPQAKTSHTWGYEIHLHPSSILEILPFFEQANLAHITFAKDQLPEKDWLAETFLNFQPLEIGEFYIHGSHETALSPPNEKKVICLDAATAFGSGRHETTASCLLLLEALFQEKPWKNALDVGCGSGLLAIAMAMLCPVPTWASDIDPEAVRVAIQNAIRNQVGDLLHIVESAGVSCEKLQHQKPFEVVVANILAEPLIQLAPDLTSAVTQGGNLVLSGFLDTQEADLLKTYQALGFQKIQRIQDKDWVAVRLKKILK